MVYTIPQIPMPEIKLYKGSPHCNPGTRTKIRFVCLHDTEGHEATMVQGVNAAAEDIARMFADPHLTPARSAHAAIDSDSVVQSVPWGFRAWAAGHHANDLGIHLELCGLAKQTKDEWFDATSLPQLQRAVAVTAMLCGRYNLAKIFLPADQLLLDTPTGVTTHRECTKAWHESDHQDPGNNFPMAEFIQALQAYT